MLLELADHRGDVDAAITILTSGEHRRYGAVVHRLRGAGRDDEVIGWMDQAVAENRVSSRLGAQGGEHWLNPIDVATTFLAAGREQDALEVLRTQFRQTPSFTTFDALVTFAEPLGHRARERDWALATARTMATSYTRGAILVEIALGEGDLAGAWAAAEEFGAGHHWRELAASAPTPCPARPPTCTDRRSRTRCASRTASGTRGSLRSSRACASCTRRPGRTPISPSTCAAFASGSAGGPR
jgi:hypothetical protein